MTEAGWIVAGLTALAITLVGIILNDHRGHLAESERRMDSIEAEAKRQDQEATHIRMDGFSRLSKVEEAFEALKEAIMEFRIENRQRHDRTDGRLDRIDQEIRRSNRRS